MKVPRCGKGWPLEEHLNMTRRVQVRVEQKMGLGGSREQRSVDLYKCNCPLTVGGQQVFKEGSDMIRFYDL